MDQLAITSGIAAASHALSLMRGVADTLRASGKSEAVAQVIDLQLAMMDLLQKHQAMFSENSELRTRVLELEALIADRGSIEFHFEAYWRKLPTGKLDGPYSPHAFDHTAEQGARANDHGRHDPCSEQHGSRPPRSWLISDVRPRILLR